MPKDFKFPWGNQTNVDYKRLQQMEKTCRKIDNTPLTSSGTVNVQPRWFCFYGACIGGFYTLPQGSVDCGILRARMVPAEITCDGEITCDPTNDCLIQDVYFPNLPYWDVVPLAPIPLLVTSGEDLLRRWDCSCILAHWNDVTDRWESDFSHPYYLGQFFDPGTGDPPAGSAYVEPITFNEQGYPVGVGNCLGVSENIFFNACIDCSPFAITEGITLVGDPGYDTTTDPYHEDFDPNSPSLSLGFPPGISVTLSRNSTRACECDNECWMAEVKCPGFCAIAAGDTLPDEVGYAVPQDENFTAPIMYVNCGDKTIPHGEKIILIKGNKCKFMGSVVGSGVDCESLIEIVNDPISPLELTLLGISLSSQSCGGVTFCDLVKAIAPNFNPEDGDYVLGVKGDGMGGLGECVLFQIGNCP